METTLVAPTAPVVGLWDDSDLFTRYRVELTFVDKVMGGVPQRPEIIEGWLRQRFTGNDNAEMRMLMLRTLEQLDLPVDAEMTMEQLHEVAKHAAAQQKGNTFFRNWGFLCLGDYQIKAGLKESTNILFGSDRWGPTRKGPKGYLAERVFVDEQWISLGKEEPDGTHLQIGQVTGPKGPRSTLTYYDYVQRASIAFTVSSLEDCIKTDQWRKILLLMQREGLGAIRSLAHGQFRVTAFDKL